MGVRANWHLDHLLADDGRDPLQASEQPRIEELGLPVDLTGDTAALRARLRELLLAEERIGEWCEVKEVPGSSCVLCPLRGSHGQLCEVGVEQQLVVTTLAVAARGDRG